MNTSGWGSGRRTWQSPFQKSFKENSCLWHKFCKRSENDEEASVLVPQCSYDPALPSLWQQGPLATDEINCSKVQHLPSLGILVSWNSGLDHSARFNLLLLSVYTCEWCYFCTLIGHQRWVCLSVWYDYVHFRMSVLCW